MEENKINKKQEQLITNLIEKSGIRGLEYLNPELRKNKSIILLAIKNSKGKIIKFNKPQNEDEDLIYEAVKQNGLSLQYAADLLKNNEKIVLAAVKQDGLSLQYVSNPLKCNKKIINTAITQNRLALQYALLKDKDYIFKLLEKSGRDLQYFEDKLKDDYEIVKKAIETNPRAFQYASERLRKNKELALMAVVKKGDILQYVDDLLKNDKDIVLAAIKENPLSLRYASDEIKHNIDIVLTTVRLNDGVVKCLDEKFIGTNRELLIKAININGNYFKFASEELKNDKEIIVQAIEKDVSNLEYATKFIKEHSEILYSKIEQHGFKILEHVKELVYNDKEMLIYLIEHYPDSNSVKNYVKYFNPEMLTNDEEIVSKIVNYKSGHFGRYKYFENASKDIQDKKEIVKKAIKLQPREFKNLSEDFRNDKEIVLAALTSGMASAGVIAYAGDLVKKNPEVMLRAIEIRPDNGHYMAYELKNDKEFMTNTIKKYPKTFEYASKNLKNDKQIALEAVLLDSNNLYHIGYEPRNDKEFVEKIIDKIGEHSFAFMSTNLRSDKEFVLYLINKYGYKIVRYAKEKLKYDNEILVNVIEKMIKETSDKYNESEETVIKNLGPLSIEEGLRKRKDLRPEKTFEELEIIHKFDDKYDVEKKYQQQFEKPNPENLEKINKAITEVKKNRQK